MTFGPAGEDLEELALGRLSRVLGNATARRVFDDALAEVGLKRIQTPDELYALSGALSRRGGFEGAVGGLLAVAAVLRGASRKAS
jgi:hypothetical protein